MDQIGTFYAKITQPPSSLFRWSNFENVLISSTQIFGYSIRIRCRGGMISMAAYGSADPGSILGAARCPFYRECLENVNIQKWTI